MSDMRATLEAEYLSFANRAATEKDSHLKERWSGIAVGMRSVLDAMTPIQGIPAEAVEALYGGQSMRHIAELAAKLRGLRIGDSTPVTSEFHEIAMALEAVLPHLTPTAGEGVAVKALEWNEVQIERGDGTSEPKGDWEAQCTTGSYYIEFLSQAGVWSLQRDDYTDLGHFDDPDAAKLAGQADRETRIRSALIPIPADTSASAVVDVPWDDCKVAFGVDDEEALDRWWESGAEELLPSGWSLCETDSAGARMVAVFRVEGVLPSVADGDNVRRLVPGLAALASSKREG